jgi:glucose/arabinose dehydrogenase
VLGKVSPTRPIVALLAVLCGGVALLAPAASGSSLPSGFRDDVVLPELPEPTALRFASDGRVFVAEKAGRITVFDSLDDTTATVFADLRTQVYNAADRGLLGLALDPDFPQQPYVYALYSYDHVLGEAGEAPKWGEPDEDGDACPKPGGTDVDECPISGRLVRLTADEGGAGDHAVENGDGEAAEQVLVEGWCQQFSSHSIGDLRFDSGGALYASGGDGASFYNPDYGQFGWPQTNQCGDPGAAVGAEPSPPDAEGGALRAQDARTLGDPTGLDGAVIRIDPDTGEGLPGNPMYASLDQNARRIVAYGFRNPFRFVVDPASEQIYLANVGWDTYEEIDRFPTSAAHAFNSGWPCYEGPGPNPDYMDLELDLCEGLYDDQSADAASPPFFYYRHKQSVIPEDGCPPNTGSAVSGLALYEGGPFPDSYDGSLFFADPVRGCIYAMSAGADGDPDPLTTTTFMSEGGLYPGVDLEVGPEGALYYVKLFGDTEEGTIHRVSYDVEAPVARLSASPEWGEAPLEVELDASASTDPEGEPLSFKWDLDGNGSFETPAGPKVERTYNGDDNVEVAVQVSDGARSNVARVTLYPGDTPPQPQIDEPLASFQWGVGQDVDFAGFGADAEEAGGKVDESGLYWRTRLYHCPSACHAHPLQVYPSVGDGSFVAPDHDYPSHLEISLTATDSRGLTATTAVEIYPRTVDLRIASDPSGVGLGAGLVSGLAPLDLRVIEGSNVVLTAPPSVSYGGGDYPWTRWSDGGARVHSVVAHASATYTASYAVPRANPPFVEPPPQTKIVMRPARRTRSRSARFLFAADLPESRFLCKLDGGPFKPCLSSRVYKHLKPGRHSLAVLAVNSDGITDPTPVVFRWRVVEARIGDTEGPTP